MWPTLSNPTKVLDNYKKAIKKHGPIRVIAFLIICFSLIWAGGRGLYFRYYKQGDVIGINTEPKPPQPPPPTLLNIENFQENIDKWETSSFYRRKKEKDWCPKSRGGNKYQVMWYKPSISAGLSNFFVRFKMADEKQDQEYEQKFILALGKKSKVSRFYLPTRRSEVVNYEKANPEQSDLIWNMPAQELSLPIKENSTVTISLKSQKALNSILYTYETVYIPANSDPPIQKTETFSYSIAFNDPNPEMQEVLVGIGSFIGGCIDSLNYGFE